MYELGVFLHFNKHTGEVQWDDYLFCCHIMARKWDFGIRILWLCLHHRCALAIHLHRHQLFHLESLGTMMQIADNTQEELVSLEEAQGHRQLELSGDQPPGPKRSWHARLFPRMSLVFYMCVLCLFVRQICSLCTVISMN